jgi:Ca2+-binding EF-hand superfamily protein
VPTVTNKQQKDDEVLRAMFTALDKNRDGFVCKNDLEILTSSLGRRSSGADIAAMLKSCQSFPEKVTYEEFVALITVGTSSNGISVPRAVQFH